MTLEAPLLSRAGEALFGPQWQSPLARSLGVNLRRMQRWAAGEFEPPIVVWHNIANLLKERQTNLSTVRQHITKKFRE